MTVTDKDAKEYQKMIDKLEKKDTNNKNEASIASFFKSCLSPEEQKQLDKTKKKWYSNSMKRKTKKLILELLHFWPMTIVVPIMLFLILIGPILTQWTYFTCIKTQRFVLNNT